MQVEIYKFCFCKGINSLLETKERPHTGDSMCEVAVQSDQGGSESVEDVKCAARFVSYKK